MRRAFSTIAFAQLMPLAGLALGCQALNNPVYFAGPTPILEAMGGETPLPTNGVVLRFRNPTDKERQDLDAQTAALGYEVPWVARDKVHVELSYKVTNVDSMPGDFLVMVDGASEFVKYDTEVVAQALQQGNNDPPTYLPLAASAKKTLAPGESYSGLVREDDFVEAELDLDALGRWLGPTTFAGVLINRSDVDPIGLEMVPPNLVVPALLEIDVRLQTTAHMTCDYSVRVRDDDDRLLHQSNDTLYETSPTLFQPPAKM